MKNILVNTNTVIIASSHNPSILSPEWLKKHKLTEESAKTFVNTPDFSLFKSESFQIIIDRQRLQITSKKKDKYSLMSLARITKQYIKLLPHIPYQSLGINFVWEIQNKKDKVFDIKTTINKKKFNLVFKDHKIDIGSIIYAKMPAYRLKMVFQPQDNQHFIVDCNFHYDISKYSIDKILKIPDNLIDFFNYTKKSIESFI